MTGRGKKLDHLSDTQLLETKLCDLGVSLRSDFLQKCIEQLQYELTLKGLKIKPKIWLSDEWFSPDGIIGIAIPFYLSHPKLMDLENQQIGEIEGGSFDWCMKLLRHEMGHVVDNAFGLRRRRKRQELFGLSKTPYPKSYDPNPYSKNFVKHLDGFYAQAHPDEDWAETFAVWLNPKSNWERSYKSKVVLSKLHYIDEVMTELKGVRPKRACYDVISPITDMNIKLKTYYKKKLKRLNINQNSFFHRDLNRIFSKDNRGLKASSLIKRRRSNLTTKLSQELGEPRYRIRRVLDTIINDCQRENLSSIESSRQAEKKLNDLLVKRTKKFIELGEHRIRM